MSRKRDINSYFDGVLENIDTIVKNSFYKDEDKENLKFVKLKIQEWYKTYKEKNTLKEIEPKELEYIGFEITDFFDRYLKTESVKENYAERLLYDFGNLEMIWKDEMLEGKKLKDMINISYDND